MSTAVQDAHRFEDLLNIDNDGSYVFRQIFSDQGWRARRRSKKTFKLLKKIDVALRAVLRDGEQVFFLTHGTASPSFVEWYFLGVVLYYMNRRAIVLTNQRVLLLQIDSRWRPRHFRSQIRWECVAQLRTTALGNMKVTFHSGGSMMFTGVPRADRKWLANVMNDVIQKLDATDQTEVEQLCPRCFEQVDGRPVACPHCAVAFKSAKTARLLSLIFPGAGDLYLGHRGFALLEMFVAVVLWFAIIGIAMDPAVDLVEALLIGFVMVLFVHGPDALTTYYIGKKGLAPEHGGSNRWRFAAAAAVPVISLITVLVAVPMKLRLRPEPTTVAGERLSDHQLRALRNAGYVGPAETVRYFYSDGPASVLQDGNLFTDDRIVSYAMLIDSTFHESARFDEVVDLHVQPADPGESTSSIYVVKNTGAVFYLIVSTLGGGDSLFADALFDRWRAVRAASPEGGIWFDGGDGSAMADGIIVRGLEPGDSREGVEDWWLQVWMGEPGTDWQLIERTAVSDRDRMFDVVTIERASGDQVQLFFEVTGDTVDSRH
jgi:hypothetical protein